MNFIWIFEYQNISWFLIWFDSRPHGILIDPTHESMAANLELKIDEKTGELDEKIGLTKIVTRYMRNKVPPKWPIH